MTKIYENTTVKQRGGDTAGVLENPALVQSLELPDQQNLLEPPPLAFGAAFGLAKPLDFPPGKTGCSALRPSPVS